MIGLTSLEVYNSIFTITDENNKFELYADNFEELKDELEEILSISDITSSYLQHEKIGPRTIQAYRKLGPEKSDTDGYIVLLMAYATSLFQAFESCLRIFVGLDEDNIQLILKQYISSFVTYEISPGIYTIRETSEAVDTLGDHKRTQQIEYDDISMKTKFTLYRFGSTIGTLNVMTNHFSKY